MGTHYKGTTDETLALDAFIKLTRATNTVAAQINRWLNDFNLTESQFGTLEVLYHLGPMCLGEIGEKILKSSGNMTTVVDNLQKRGLVQRQRDPEDRRQVIVSLTEEGEALIRRIFPEHVEGVVEAFAVLTPEEQTELARLCKILGTQRRHRDVPEEATGQHTQPQS